MQEKNQPDEQYEKQGECVGMEKGKTRNPIAIISGRIHKIGLGKRIKKTTNSVVEFVDFKIELSFPFHGYRRLETVAKIIRTRAGGGEFTGREGKERRWGIRKREREREGTCGWAGNWTAPLKLDGL